MKKIAVLLLAIIPQLINSQKKIVVQSVLPQIISKFPAVRDFTISPNQNEIYFTAQGYAGELSTIIKVVKKEDQWSAPEVAPFSGQYKDLEAMFSPNGLKLYFVSDRPNEHTTKETKNYDIWYLERSSIDSDWSSPINIGSPINTAGDEFYPSVAKNGNLYFTSTTASSTKGKDDIFISKWEDNKYVEPVSLPETINSEGYEYNSYIAHDESFLIFGGYNRKNGLGSGDLYISYKDQEGKWSVAQNLIKINSDKMDYCPFYDTKTQTLYFTSKRNSIRDDFTQSKNLKELLGLMNSYENGLSRIYSSVIQL
ncbi:hypothetical protein [Aquimarina celericrescens]|uniref:WD40 repeat protein n=1 Tax=Aquimarina celericrescens TaxID=1964542 RepID=A0ABW5AYD9_9FLAO|nr:PD40 domain-containing protein [Aquimarina celericrescens]